MWIEGIRKQTIKSEIWVWDDSGDYPAGSGEDFLITTSRRNYAQGRLLLAGIVKTKYIYNQDDDLAINDPALFEKFIEVSKKYPDSFIGWNGRRAEWIKNWEKAYSFPEGSWVDSMEIDSDMNVDMVNTGVSFYRTALINQVPINPFQNDIETISEEEFKFGDDMWVSRWLKSKRVMPFKLLDHYDWLNEFPERGCAISKQPNHMNVRDSLMKRWWKK